MPTPIVMPQMGESIAEGTIVRWIKKVGDAVDRDEPLFEISTDKVDAEIPSPAAGVLTEIKVAEGETVPVNAVVGTIGQPGEASAPEPARAAESAARREAPRSGSGADKAAASTQSQGDGQPDSRPPAGTRPASRPAARRTNGSEAAAAAPAEDVRRQKSSPLVRRIARDHDVDISRIHGSGIGGRVTKHDILGYLDEMRDAEPSTRGARSAPDAESRARGAADQLSPESRIPSPAPRVQSPEPRIPSPEPRVPGSESPVARSEARVEVQPLSVMRRKIAEHMILSRRTSAHVHSVFHVNFSAIEKIRQQKKADYERLGAKLTYMAFIAKAAIDALRRHPIVNASLDADNVIYKKDINVGIAVALESGLIVPVIRHADEKNMLGLSRAIADVADRARAKQLKPEEVQGGTFTITNPGQFGSQFGLPIINQPQVAILGVGTIEKRPVVVDDAIAIRTMAYLTLGYDHRLVDGAVGDQFMPDIKHQLEHFDANQV